jgi:surface protein
MDRGWLTEENFQMGNKLNNGYIGSNYLNNNDGSLGVVSGSKDYIIRESDYLLDPLKMAGRGSTGPYVRPAEWVAMPDVTAGSNKFAGIFAVYDHDANFVAFNFGGATFGVDWGDGTTSYIARGGTAYKQYTRSTYSGLTSQVFRGYKTLPIVVTTPSGGNLTSMNLIVLHNQPNLTPVNRRAYGNQWLEYKISAPSLSSIFGTDNSWTTFNSMIERIEFVGSFSSMTSLSFAFIRHHSLREIVLFDTTNVTNFYSTFLDCYLLEEVPWFNTANGTNLSGLFRQCYSLNTIPLLNTANATDMSYMFYLCLNLAQVPMLDTRKATAMNNMFEGCRSLFTVPAFNTQNVTNMASMFSQCFALRRVPLMDTQKVTAMNGMFANCWSLVEVPLFDTKNVTTMAGMFGSALSLQKIPKFDTRNVTNFSFFTYSGTAIRELPDLDTSNATNMSYMLWGCSRLRRIPRMNTSKVTTFFEWLTGTQSLREVPELDFSACTTLEQSFYNTSAFFSNNKVVSAPKATNAGNMFRYSGNFWESPNLDLSAIRNFAFMFDFAGLKTLPGITFPTAASAASIQSNAFQGMFKSCYRLQEINISPEFNILNASAGGANTTMYDNMFQECYSLGSVKGITGFIYNISFLGCKLSATGLNDIYRSLGTVGASGSGTRTITVTNNWGASAGLGHDTTLATSKGWTVVG